MNKSSKMVSLFLSTALVLSSAGCTTEQKVVYDKDGNPIVQQVNSNPGFFSGFFGPFGPLGPFGFFSGRSSGYSSGVMRSQGVSSGSLGSSQNSVDSDSLRPKTNTGVAGVSPWGRSGSTNTSGGSGSSGETGISSSSSGGAGKSSGSSGGTGITSGSHGGIGGGGSSAS